MNYKQIIWGYSGVPTLCGVHQTFEVPWEVNYLSHNYVDHAFLSRATLSTNQSEMVASLIVNNVDVSPLIKKYNFITVTIKSSTLFFCSSTIINNCCSKTNAIA